MINVNQLYLQVKGKWKSVYPIYFDATKTIAQGRRLPKDLCIENPKIQEVATAVGMLQIRNILQPHKLYSRDYFQIGRLKVQLVNNQGQPIKPNIPSKKQLLKKVAQVLKELRKNTKK